MKRRLLYITALLVILIIITSSAYGQSSTLDKLMAKTWEYQYPAGYDNSTSVKTKYSCCIQTTILYGRIGGEYGTLDQSFYLSDNIETEFDDSKVGKNQNGRYLVVKGTHEMLKISVFEILKLDVTEFKIKSVENSPIISTFKAVP